ncbi:hypothetical protein V1512DRAFT_266581 [Lipomyces arxii]|uniref:uncharacterized protein n=1 Tax=Lipomyces arxii TaxID=56418 RepID=UPI0034CEC73D
MSDSAQIIEMIARGSEAFKAVYYDALDNRRTSIAELIEPNAPIIYNGNPMVGGAQYAELYAKMPVTAHDVTGFDCHPLMTASPPGQIAIALTVSGKVRVGTDRSKGLCGFSESFVLRPQPDGKYRVGSLCYRLIFKVSQDLEP